MGQPKCSKTQKNFFSLISHLIGSNTKTYHKLLFLIIFWYNVIVMKLKQKSNVCSNFVIGFFLHYLLIIPHIIYSHACNLMKPSFCQRHSQGKWWYCRQLHGMNNIFLVQSCTPPLEKWHILVSDSGEEFNF